MQHLCHGVLEPVELRVGEELWCTRPTERHVDRRNDPSRPGPHHRHPVGEKRRLVDAVGDEQRRRAGLDPDPLQFDVHLPPQNLIERAERLVHEENSRLGDERPSNRHPLTHAARQLAR